MKKLQNRTASIALAAVVSLCSLNAFAAVGEDSEKREVTIVFNWEEEGVAPTKTTNVADFATKTTTDSYTSVPLGYFTKSGYTFSGWTIDGVRGYAPGAMVTLPEGLDTVVFEMCWLDPTEQPYNVEYVFEYRGETIERPEYIEDELRNRNEVFSPDYTTILTDKYISKGIMYDGVEFKYGDYLVMPDHDIVLRPIFYKKVNVTYYAGDVDRLNGNDTVTYEKIEASDIELSGADRFSRNGFNLVGWLSSYDGEIYAPGLTVKVPDEDYTYTAVWAPKMYTVVFNQGNGGKALKVQGETDSAVICPEPTITVAGKVFAGWRDSNGDIYAAGSEYIVPGAKPGLGISLTAVWADDYTPPTTTTTTPPETTTTTTETTTAAPETTTTTTDGSQTGIDYGDANCDGKVTVADAVAILQHIGNRDKYGLKEQGLKNADVDGEPGVTPNDALTIQKLDAGVIDKIPVVKDTDA